MAVDEETRQKLDSVLSRPGVRLLAATGGDYLFSVKTTMREEYPHYRFFVLGRLLEIRRIGWFSNQYSMAGFPRDLLPRRPEIEARFAELAMSTEDGLGWFAPARWEELTPEQQAIAKPRFMEDDVRYFSM